MASELITRTNRKGTEYYEDINGIIVSKVCAVCGEVKQLTDYQKHKAGLGGRSSTCKPCKSVYYDENKQRFEERNELNKDSIRDRQRTYYESNKERLNQCARSYYTKHKERIREYNRDYRERNKDYYTEFTRNWRLSNPEKYAVIVHRRRARKLSLIDDLTPEETAFTLDYFEGCALTGATDDLHLDHVVALATGNSGTTFGNIIPLRADLNISKNDLNIFEWFDANKERYGLSETRFNSLITWLSEVNEMTADEYRSFVCWCYANKRDIDEIKRDQRNSIEIWRESLTEVARCC